MDTRQTIEVGKRVLIISELDYGTVIFKGLMHGKTIYEVKTKDYTAWFYENELQEVK